MLLLFAFFTVNRFCHMYLFPFPENILPESLPTNFHLLQVHFRHTEKNQVHDLFLCTGNELYSLFSVWKIRRWKSHSQCKHFSLQNFVISLKTQHIACRIPFFYF